MASTLSYRELGLSWQSAPRRILALGDRTHAADEGVSGLASSFAIRVLEAPRTADPRRFGSPSAAGDWYVDGDEGPDPHAFHLSLAALEASLLEIREGDAILFGVGQGAVLSLSLACCWSERLVAVVACAGELPTFPTGGLEERPLAGLPVLCLGVSGASRRELSARGGRVTQAATRGIEAWLTETLQTASR